MHDTNGSDAGRDDLAGKAKRVVGFFVFMVGSGIVLESAASWMGGLIMLIGAAVFIWGVAEATSRSAPLPAREDAPPAPMAPPTRSNL